MEPHCNRRWSDIPHNHPHPVPEIAAKRRKGEDKEQLSDNVISHKATHELSVCEEIDLAIQKNDIAKLTQLLTSEKDLTPHQLFKICHVDPSKLMPLASKNYPQLISNLFTGSDQGDVKIVTPGVLAGLLATRTIEDIARIRGLPDRGRCLYLFALQSSASLDPNRNLIYQRMLDIMLPGEGTNQTVLARISNSPQDIQSLCTPETTPLELALLLCDPALVKAVFETLTEEQCLQAIKIITKKNNSIFLVEHVQHESFIRKIVLKYPRSLEFLPVESLPSAIRYLREEDFQKYREAIKERLHNLRSDSLQNLTVEQMNIIQNCEKLLLHIEKIGKYGASTEPKTRKRDHLVYRLKELQDIKNIHDEMQEWSRKASRYYSACQSDALNISFQKEQHVYSSIGIITALDQRISRIINLTSSNRTCHEVVVVSKDSSNTLTQGVAIIEIQDGAGRVDLHLLATHPRNLNLKWSKRAATGTGTAILASIAKYALDRGLKSISLSTLPSSEEWYKRLGFKESTPPGGQLILSGDALRHLATKAV